MTVNNDLLKAKRHIKKGEADLAAQIYKSVLDKFPMNKRAIDGLKALEQPDAVKAITAAEPSQEKINELVTLYNQGLLQHALERGQILARQFPKVAFFPNLLGAANAGLDRLEQAVINYTKALQIKPDYAEAYNNLGSTLKTLGRPEEAVTSLTKALQIKPDYAEAHNNLGNALNVLDEPEEAVASYTKALQFRPEYAEAHNNMGNALNGLGRHEEAVTSLTKALQIKPDYAEAHNNLGNALKALARHEEAVTSLTKALQIKPDFAEAHNNMGNALIALARHEEAIASLTKALQIKPDFAEAQYNLGVALGDFGRHEEAIASYTKALQIKPDFAEAHNNLGIAFKRLEKLEDAVANYHKALDLKPDYAEAYNNLGNALKDLNKLSEAFECHRRAIALCPQNDLHWAGLAASLETLPFTSADENLWQVLLQLLERSSVRPSNVVLPIMSAIRHHQNFSPILELTGSRKPEIEIVYADLAQQLSAIPLFLGIMALSPIFDLEIERMLTFLRRAMLEETVAGKLDENVLPLSAALALQCFTNEYVFSETDEEKVLVEHLEQRIAMLVQEHQEVPSSFIAALGAYRPLYSFSWAQTLGKCVWAGDIRQVIERQILEPLEELTLRSQIPCLTSIQDTISQLVREQYEENPYPRWIKTDMHNKGGSIGTILQEVLGLDLGDYVSPEQPEILIAGCGTGQHIIQTFSRFSDARVLAVDLSLNSLSYAIRKTKEFDLSNIECAQADIMELGGVERRFDLIECSGVLHHLGDPLAGWQVLVDLLRPGGLMKIALYSEIARRDIVNARSLIAEKGYTTSLEDIRRCRQDIIMKAEDGDPEMAEICKIGDFFSLSECRDLLFHVQEHRFTLLQIEEALEPLKLKFLGFEIRQQSALQKFRESHSNGHSQISLSQWHKFELSNPDTFKGMYQFWCKKM